MTASSPYGTFSQAELMATGLSHFPSVGGEPRLTGHEEARVSAVCAVVLKRPSSGHRRGVVERGSRSSHMMNESTMNQATLESAVTAGLVRHP
jgi:hypothetical protein